MEWNGLTIHTCQLVNIPTVDGNYIGAEFMRRFNFVLAYKKMIKHKKQDHLYIQPVQGFDSIQAQSFISKFGFRAEEKDGKKHIYVIGRGG